MPSGLIEDQNGVSAKRDLRSDLVEIKLHSFGVAGRQHEGRGGWGWSAGPLEKVAAVVAAATVYLQPISRRAEAKASSATVTVKCPY